MKSGATTFVEANRSTFLKVRDATERIVANLDDDQLKRLENPSTRLAAQKSILAKILGQVVNRKINCGTDGRTVCRRRRSSPKMN
jgi:hypothetical protein